MTMRILVATDGSADADGAIEWLMHLPLPADASVEVVSVIAQVVLRESGGRAPLSKMAAQAEGVVEQARRRLAGRWPDVAGRVLHGDAREAIAEAAYRSGVHLVVVGARGLGAAASFFLGSVSLGVVRHAPCAVLVCRGQARPLEVVVVGHDGSPDAAAALSFFSALPLPRDLTVRVVGVVQPLGLLPSSEVVTPELASALKRGEDELRSELEPALNSAVEALRPRVATVTSATPVGSPADVLVREAAGSHADLVVVGARGKGMLKRMLLGSVSESVLRHAVCPVLIERRPL
jgi:nucleotide-binding universal stress UspA family protein